MIQQLIEIIYLVLITILPIIIAIAYFTLAERKIMSAVQRRVGPNVVGYFGVLQPFSDGLHLIFKEFFLPLKSSTILFFCSPVLVFSISLIYWLILPTSSYDVIYNINYGVLLLLFLSSLNVYGIIISGWASTSRYPLLSILRASSQLISYELIISLVILIICIRTNSFNLLDVIFVQSTSYSNIYLYFPLFIIFFISALAETNRIPFDLVEAEAEVVSGYKIEYSSLPFALFFLAEYCNIIVMSNVITLFFFGNLYSYGILFSSFSIASFCFLFILIRATYPRFRYDQLMILGWHILLPITVGFFYYYIILNVYVIGPVFTIEMNQILVKID